VPILTAVRNSNWGKCYMANHFSINLRYQGDGKRLGGSQGIYDELLGLIAIGMICESRLGDLEYYFNI